MPTQFQEFQKFHFNPKILILFQLLQLNSKNSSLIPLFSLKTPKIPLNFKIPSAYIPPVATSSHGVYNDSSAEYAL